MFRFWLLLFPFLASPAFGQVFVLELKDEKLFSRNAKLTVTLDGKKVFLVEIGAGVVWKSRERRVVYSGNADNWFFVLDPADPSAVPYRKVKGRLEPERKYRKRHLRVHGSRIEKLRVHILEENLATLAREYSRRGKEVERLKELRDDEPRRSRSWLAMHRMMMKGCSSMEQWLVSNGYHLEARDWRVRIRKEGKKADAAMEERLQQALESVEPLPVPEKLTSLAAQLSGGELEFKVQGSQHFRVTYPAAIPDERIRQSILLAEEAVDGFRASLVDPWVGEAFPDRIPDGVFQEFFFGPDDLAMHEQFLTEHYGLSWGRRKEARLESAGLAVKRASSPSRLEYWRLTHDDGAYLNGIVLHRLGHALAEIHYGLAKATVPQDWLEEAVGFFLSFELLGRNTVTCSKFEPPEPEGGTSVGGTREKKNERKTGSEMRGLREVMAEVALVGPPIDRLAITELFDFESPDIAKAWAFFEFFAREGGLEGQLWLRACGEAATKAKGETGPFLASWRRAAAETFDLKGDAIADLEKRWQEWLSRTYPAP